MTNSKLPAYVFVAFAGVLLVLAVYKTFVTPKTGTKTGVGVVTDVPNTDKALVPPTLSPQEKEIIAKIETLSVDITETAVTPAVITAKQYDQVAFFNKTKDKTITVDGGSWGKVPLAAGENMTQAFKTVGSFKYQVTSLGLSGEVVVK